MRSDGRRPDQMRTIKIKRDVMKFAEGSCLIEIGNTRVICTASVEDRVPHFLRDTGKGWITAEYGMLPRSCQTRIERESSRGRPSGRTQEIQRLIGRSMRAVIELEKLGERSIWMDCDVLQGDGGTRTASITGSFIALVDALLTLKKKKAITDLPVKDYVSAVSVGIIDGEPCLDLNYEEDSKAEVDMNIVMTGTKMLVEVQGTAEKNPFSKKGLDKLVLLAEKGIAELTNLQRKILKIDL